MESMYERSLKVMPPVTKRATTLGIVKGEGSYVYSETGEKFLDFASGVAVNNLGHNHPKVVAAAQKQMGELVHGGHNVVYYESYVRLAEKLAAINGPESMVYFSNSGAEANDGAMKLAKYVTNRPAIISFKGSFHGRTIGAMSITASSAKYRKHYEGMLPSIYFAEFPYLYRTPYLMEEGQTPKAYFNQFTDLFDNVIDPYSIAAMIIEPIQGEGGYIVPPKDFLQYIRQICDTYGILLIFDEVQTGFGRTGHMFASQYFGIEPDIRTVAKGIANGFPLSAILAKKEIMAQWEPGAHGGTFGGNPVACAAALATLEVLENGAIDNAKEMGAYFKEELLKLQEKYAVIGDVRGVGLMLAIELVHADKVPAADYVQKIIQGALAKHLILLSCGTHKNVLRFIAPTTVKKSEIDEAIAIVDSILETLE